MGRSGTTGKKPGVVAPVREKGRQELEAEARSARIAAHMERIGIKECGDFDGEEPEGVIFWPRWESRRGSLAWDEWRDYDYYELFLTVRRTAWGELDKDASEIRHLEPHKLERLLALTSDGTGLAGFRKALEIYDYGFDEGRSEGYNEGFSSGESFGADPDGYYGY